MRKLLCSLLIAECCLLSAGFAQTTQTGSDYIARRLQLPLADPPQKVPSATVSVSGNPGPATYFYWIVTNSLVGASSPAGPFAIATAPNTLGVSNFNVISWSTSLGGVNYDVLRTSTPGPPSGACNCAVATAVTGNTVNDQSNTLNAYTVNTLDPSTLLWTLTNESTGAGVSQFTLRAGGVPKFTLASNAGTATVVTPFAAVAHQFLNALSPGGVFSAAQPSSADLSDGNTGTGAVAHATSPSISSPSITGTDSGSETLQNKLVIPRTVGVTDGTSITPNSDTSDIVTQTNTQVAGTLTINAPTGSPADGQKLLLRIKTTNAQTYSFNAVYRFSTTTTAPTTTTAGKTDYLGFAWNGTDSKWDTLGVDQAH